MDEVERFQVLHAGRYLLGYVQQHRHRRRRRGPQERAQVTQIQVLEHHRYGRRPTGA